MIKNRLILIVAAILMSVLPALAYSQVSLVSPSGTVSTDPSTFSWNEDSQATWYKISIRDSNRKRVFSQWYETGNNYADYPDATCTDGTCSAVVSADLTSGGYQWFVKPWNEDGGGKWSSAMAFTVNDSTVTDSDIRVPAEWEPHAATWIQWPGQWEADMRSAFADVINVIQAYEPVRLLTSTASEQTAAKAVLAGKGVPDTNITWHIIPVDNAWMRDNGPIYVTENGKTRIQNWEFDAWGGNFGSDVESANDNLVPEKVGEYLGIEVENRQDYIMEKGNLEFNGTGTLVVNWDCQDDRNPGMTKAEHESILQEAFGLTRIIWAYGHFPGEGTTGHIDGTARFVDEDTIVITQYGTATEKNLVLACEAAGIEVVRYPGDPNWLVGNGFVAAMSNGDTTTDAQATALLESLFPERDIHMIDGSDMADNGGGIHCITNDQPVID